MESCSAPLQVLSQSKLIENTCPQQLVKVLAPMRYYMSKSQYFPTENNPHLDTDASQLDMSSRGKYSIPIKNMEIWEKRVRNLVAINSHADLFSSAAYLCLQKESMSINVLSRLMEVVAKSIKHATTMLTILVIELFQARHDTAITLSKLLFDHSRL